MNGTSVISKSFGFNIWLLGDSALRASLVTFNMNTKQIKWVQTKSRFDELQLASSAIADSATSTLFASFNWVNLLVYSMIVSRGIGIVVYVFR